jgi:crossover junction endodeoxyribonuclease RuvC
MATIIGIDPGLKGGIAVLPDVPGIPGEPELHVMPVITIPKASGGEKHEYDEPGIVEILRGAQERFGPVHVAIERQQAMPGQGVTSMFSTGLGYGILRGIVTALGLPNSRPQAKAWQKVMLAGMPRPATGKASAKIGAIVCQRLWPGVSLLASSRSRIPHEGLADALLIAEYTRRSLAARQDADRYARRPLDSEDVLP